MINVVVYRKGHQSIRAIDGAGRGEYEMRDVPVATALKNIHEPYQIALHICMRIFQTVANTRLSGHMNDPVKFMLGKELFHALPVCQVQEGKLEIVEWFESLKARLFQAYIIVTIEVIKADDLVSIIKKAPG